MKTKTVNRNATKHEKKTSKDQCFYIVHASDHVFEKYKATLQWLVEGCLGDKESHLEMMKRSKSAFM